MDYLPREQTYFIVHEGRAVARDNKVRPSGMFDEREPEELRHQPRVARLIYIEENGGEPSVRLKKSGYPVQSRLTS